MNQADSLKLIAGLEKIGYAAAEDPDRADLAVVNTCSVRQHAEDRAYGRLHAPPPAPRARRGPCRSPSWAAWSAPRRTASARRSNAASRGSTCGRGRSSSSPCSSAGAGGWRPRCLRGRVLGRDLRRADGPDGLRARRPRLRQVLHLLHRPAAARARGVARAGRRARRGAAPRDARRARGDAARPDRRGLRPRPRRSPPTSRRCSRASRRSRASSACASSPRTRRT